jgi:ankyrin repeat protein
MRMPRAGGSSGWKHASILPSAPLGGIGMKTLSIVVRRLALGMGAALSTSLAVAQVGPSHSDIQGYAGLQAAAWQGDVEAIERITAQPAARDALAVRDGNGRTPLHLATFARRPDAVRALLRAGADSAALDKDRYDAVTIAAVADDEATLRVLLQGGASAKLTTSRYDGTALIAAAHLGHDGVVRQLIAAGAPLNHVNNLHWTALIEAVVLGDGGPRHQAVVSALLQACADTQSTDREGRTALQLARERGHAAMVRALEAAAARDPQSCPPSTGSTRGAATTVAVEPADASASDGACA